MKDKTDRFLLCFISHNRTHDISFCCLTNFPAAPQFHHKMERRRSLHDSFFNRMHGHLIFTRFQEMWSSAVYHMLMSPFGHETFRIQQIRAEFFTTVTCLENRNVTSPIATWLMRQSVDFDVGELTSSCYQNDLRCILLFGASYHGAFRQIHANNGSDDPARRRLSNRHAQLLCTSSKTSSRQMERVGDNPRSQPRRNARRPCLAPSTRRKKKRGVAAPCVSVADVLVRSGVQAMVDAQI